MSEHTQSPSERAAEIVHEMRQETLQELGNLALNAQRTAGQMEAARRRQNQRSLERATEEAAKRLEAHGYPNAEWVDTLGYHSRPYGYYDLDLQEPGWRVLDRTIKRSSAVSERESFFLLARGLDDCVFLKETTTLINGQPGRSIRAVVQSNNVATLTQNDFDLLLENLQTLGVWQQHLPDQGQ